MKKSSVIFIWGLAIGVAMCATYLAIYLTGNITNTGLVISAHLVLFIGLLLGMFQYRNKANGGYASYGELYKTGLLITLVTIVVAVAYWIIFLQLNPSYLDKVREYQATMINARVNQETSPEEKQMMAKITKISVSPLVTTLSVVFNNLISGAILSLITAAICSKSKPPFEEDDNNPLPS